MHSLWFIVYVILGLGYKLHKLIDVCFNFRANKKTDEPVPTTLTETLLLCNQVQFPNVHTMLRLILITPVTTATVERSNSSLRFIKNAYRSTMSEERLNALLLLFIHRDIELDYNKIVDIFALRNARRMLLINLLGDC